MKFLFKDYQESVSFQKVEKMRTIFLRNNKWERFPNIGCDQHLSEEIGISYGSKLLFPEIQDFIVNRYAMVDINATVDSTFQFKLPASLLNREFTLENISKETLLAEIESRISPFFSFGLEQMDNPFILHLGLKNYINGYRLTSFPGAGSSFLFEDEERYCHFHLSAS